MEDSEGRKRIEENNREERKRRKGRGRERQLYKGKRKSEWKIMG